MASRSLRKIQGLNHGEIRVSGSFRPNGASGIVASSSKGNGWSVARTSAGLYTVTFADKYQHLISCVAKARSADGHHIDVVPGDYVAADKTLQLRARRGAPIFVPLDITTAKLIAADVIGNTTEGLFPDGNTTPSLQRVNSATDKALRVIWGAGVVTELQFAPIVIPPAAETANAAVVMLHCEKDANANTVTIDVQAFAGKGDTEMGAATSTIAQALGRYTVTLAAADVGAAAAAGSFLNISLVPSAHAGDALHMYAAAVQFETLVDLASDADNVINFEAVFGNMEFI